MVVVARSRARTWAGIAAALVACCAVAVLITTPARGTGERLGVYLDEPATLCDAPLLPFETRTVFICGFPPPDSLVGGALLSLQRPSGVQILAVRLNRAIVFSANGNVEGVDQVDLRFRDCVLSLGPLVLMEVDIFDSDLSGPRPDLELHLIGAGADSLAHDVPQWKICDPNDPESFRGVVRAVAVDAVFNCTHECACTTAVAATTWAAVKSLYQGR